MLGEQTFGGTTSSRLDGLDIDEKRFVYFQREYIADLGSLRRKLV
jgi:hypothetical protein